LSKHKVEAIAIIQVKDHRKVNKCLVRHQVGHQGQQMMAEANARELVAIAKVIAQTVAAMFNKETDQMEAVISNKEIVRMVVAMFNKAIAPMVAECKVIARMEAVISNKVIVRMVVECKAIA
jgi:hypothetical protein